ncbi:MAG: hypothetical protein II678_04040 [Erysipelotrichaceae bacterium]|nr:hypothetical protein [Erysipelotrichaceae bacterium]
MFLLLIEFTRNFFSHFCQIINTASFADNVLYHLGVRFIVLTCIIEGGYEKLLEEGDYKRINKKISSYDGIFWSVATAVYLGWSFYTNDWHRSWIVWPIAGVLYAAYTGIIRVFVKENR